MLGGAKGFAPVAHQVEDGQKRRSFLRQGVFHLRRDLIIGLAGDALHLLKFFKLSAEHLVGDLRQMPFQLSVTEGPFFRKDAGDKPFPLSLK